MKKNMLSSRIAGVLMLGVGPALVGTLVPAEVFGSLNQEEGGVHFSLKACASLLEHDSTAKEALDQNLQELVRNGFNAEKLLTAAEEDVLFDERLQEVGVSSSGPLYATGGAFERASRPLSYESFRDLLSWVDKTASWVYSTKKKRLFQRGALLLALGQLEQCSLLLSRSPAVQQRLEREVGNTEVLNWLSQERSDLNLEGAAEEEDDLIFSSTFSENSEDASPKQPPTNESSLFCDDSQDLQQGGGNGSALFELEEQSFEGQREGLPPIIEEVPVHSSTGKAYGELDGEQQDVFTIECDGGVSILCRPETGALRGNEELLRKFGWSFEKLLQSASKYLGSAISRQNVSQKVFDFGGALGLLESSNRNKRLEAGRLAGLLVLGQQSQAVSAAASSPAAAAFLEGECGSEGLFDTMRMKSAKLSDLQRGAQQQQQPFGEEPFVFQDRAPEQSHKSQNFQEASFGQPSQEQDFSKEEQQVPPETQKQNPEVNDNKENKNESVEEEKDIKSEKSLNNDSNDNLSSSHLENIEEDQNRKVELAKNSDDSNNNNSNSSADSKNEEENKSEEEFKKFSKQISKTSSARPYNSNSGPSNRNDDLNEASEHFSQKGPQKKGGSKLVGGKALMRAVRGTLGVSGTYDKETVEKHTAAMNRLADQMAQRDQMLQGLATNVEALLNLLKKKVK